MPTHKMAIKKPDFYSPKTEAQAFVNTFRPISGNNDLRKYVTLAMVGLWVSVAFLSSLGLAVEPPWFDKLGYFIALLLGRMWQLEVQSLEGSGGE